MSFSFLLLLQLLLVPAINGDDARALLSLKFEIDPSNSLQWDSESSSGFCSWPGIKECNGDGRVTKLVVEFSNLTGTLKSETLAPMDQIRVLSFKSNSLSGPVPDLSPLFNLKSLYLNNNRFSGKIPSSMSSLHRLKIIVLSDNLLTGEIPPSFTQIQRLYTLYLENNRLTGQIPSFRQQSLKFLNFSNNNLSGEIPRTKTLTQFDLPSFLNIPNLCGAQIRKPCMPSNQNPIFPPISSPLNLSPRNPPTRHKNKKKLVKILAGSISAFIALAIVACILACLLLGSKENKKKETRDVITDKPIGDEEAAASGHPGVKREFSWENEGLGKLVFCGGGVGEMYSLEELLKASAETLGRGTVGSTYKAVMESGFIVTVKRLKDSENLGVEEFRGRMEEIGRLRHPNLVPLRAYFQAKEERLLVYDYFPNGSLFSLIHGMCI